MPQRSHKVGNATFTATIDWDKRRDHLTTQRRKSEFREVTAARIATELDKLDSYLRGRGGSQADIRNDLALLADLRAAYDNVFASPYPSQELQQCVVNLELFVLKKVVADAPLPVTRTVLTRLEDLYVDGASRGFKSNGGSPNEKLESIGRLIKPKRFQLPLSDFPIMETFMVPAELFDDYYYGLR